MPKTINVNTKESNEYLKYNNLALPCNLPKGSIVCSKMSDRKKSERPMWKIVLFFGREVLLAHNSRTLRVNIDTFNKNWTLIESPKQKEGNIGNFSNDEKTININNLNDNVLTSTKFMKYHAEIKGNQVIVVGTTRRTNKTIRTRNLKYENGERFFTMKGEKFFFEKENDKIEFFASYKKHYRLELSEDKSEVLFYNAKNGKPYRTETRRVFDGFFSFRGDKFAIANLSS